MKMNMARVSRPNIQPKWEMTQSSEAPPAVEMESGAMTAQTMTQAIRKPEMANTAGLVLNS